MFRMRKIFNKNGEIVKIGLSIGLPLINKRMYDTSLTSLILLLLDIYLYHELTNIAEAFTIDFELLKIPLYAQFIEI